MYAFFTLNLTYANFGDISCEVKITWNGDFWFISVIELPFVYNLSVLTAEMEGNKPEKRG